MKCNFPVLFFFILLLAACEKSEDEDCEACNTAISNYYSALLTAPACDSNLADARQEVEDNCSAFAAREAIGAMQESCFESAFETPACPSPGRNNIRFLIGIYSSGLYLPDPVTMILEYNGRSVSEDLGIISRYETITLPGYVPGGQLMSVKLYNTNSNELLKEATPKITFYRHTNTSQIRSIEVRHDQSNGYRLFFYYFE